MSRTRTFLAPCLLLVSACTTLQTREYAPTEVPPPDPERRIVAVTRTSGVQVTFDRRPGDPPAAPAARIDEGAVVGTVNGQPVRVDLSEARSVWIEEEADAIGRTLLLLGGVALGASIALAFAFGVGV